MRLTYVTLFSITLNLIGTSHVVFTLNLIRGISNHHRLLVTLHVRDASPRAERFGPSTPP